MAINHYWSIIYIVYIVLWKNEMDRRSHIDLGLR